MNIEKKLKAALVKTDANNGIHQHKEQSIPPPAQEALFSAKII